jgi:CheY-like chemotaxis protein
MSFDAQSHPKTILVVDDDLSVLTVVKCMLEGSDYNVLLANSSEVARAWQDVTTSRLT